MKATALEIQQNAQASLEAARVLINRSYLSEFGNYAVEPFDAASNRFNPSTDLRIFRVERIVQDNQQSVLESTTAAYTSLGAAGFAVFLFLKSDGTKTDLYIGTRGPHGKSLGLNAGDLLRETFKGHFGGSALQKLDAGATQTLLDGIRATNEQSAASITGMTGVPALSTENRAHFMQGLERFIDAAENRSYQALILAEPVASPVLDRVRMGYEQVATELSPLHKRQLGFGQQESQVIGQSISESISNSLGESLSLTETWGTSVTDGTTRSLSTSTNSSHSSASNLTKAMTVGTTLASAVAGPAIVPVMVAGSALTSAVGSHVSESVGESQSESTSESNSISQGGAEARSTSTTQTVTGSDSRSINSSEGSSLQITVEIVDKGIELMLSKIDHHLQRLDEAKAYGGWNAAAYFIGDSSASSEALASLFMGVVRGSNSSHEEFSLATWRGEQRNKVLEWFGVLTHPPLRHSLLPQLAHISLSPATLLSGKELAIQMSLPRRSTSTVAVLSSQPFGRIVQRLDGQDVQTGPGRRLTLGNIRHLWQNLPQTIELNLDQLSSHVFVSGSTGAGKSNTLYEILRQIEAEGIPFLVIEPAKGEYKHVFGHRNGVRVFGTHPVQSELLRINPFCFPPQIHVLEHVDRLIEIFNVCWPMYAAMPAVLKESVLHAYQNAGWDLSRSVNRYRPDLFPAFGDLLLSLEAVISASAYSSEMKGNYIGSLVTRVRSLTNGLNGEIFAPKEVDSSILFDSSVIVDLSRVGSSETKSLIMGVLIMRLSEYRMAQGGMNRPLRHLTVLEEAHNILKRSAVEGAGEGGGLIGKSVAMLTNAIAEMRTYGEGFIIVDQSPHAVDPSAIRNTNTKIIMRLPDEIDRRLIGKSVALRDEQLDEIARLPKGTAIVYQNDWLEPVQCQIQRFVGVERPYVHVPCDKPLIERSRFNRQVLNLLLARRVDRPDTVDMACLDAGLNDLPLLISSKIALIEVIVATEGGSTPAILEPQNFGKLSCLLVDLLGCRDSVQRIMDAAINFSQLRLLLKQLLKAEVVALTDSLELAAEQCLVKDYSLQAEGNIEIYSAWNASLNGENAK